MKKLDAVKKGWDHLNPFHRAFAGVLAFLAIGQTSGILAPYVTGKVLNAIQSDRTMYDVVVLATVTLLVSLLALYLNKRKDIYELSKIDFRTAAHLTNLTLGKILGLSIGQHRSQNSGLTQSVITKGQGSMEQLTMLLLYHILTTSASIIITVGLLTWFNVRIGFVVLVCVVVYVWLTVQANIRYWPRVKKFRDLAHENNKAYREILSGINLIQINSQEERVQKEHADRMQRWVDMGTETWVNYDKGSYNRAVLPLLAQFIVLLMGAFLVRDHGFLYGDLLIIWAWTNRATNQVGIIGQYQRQLLMHWGEVKKYFAIHDVVPAIEIQRNPIRPEKFSGRVEFRNITFTYSPKPIIDNPEKPRKTREDQLPALKNVSFVIEPGEHIAFVGESGAGKSTIINLLVRGWEQDEGQILVDGHDLRLLDLKHFRQNIGVVEQNVHYFDTTIRYNMLFGLNGHGQFVTDEEMDRIAEMSRINKFGHRLTEGWETVIGENGVELSGGERQRVGIARALIKDPRILILDEATSSLDQRNERLIKEAVDEMSEGRTTIVVAHRLSTVRNADRIFVMDKGQIISVGTHEELLETSTVYQELVQDQLFTL